MTVNAGDAAAFPLTVANHEKCIGSATFTIGVAGAIDATDASDAKIAGDDFASGLCNFTYPACQKVRFMLSVLSDGTVNGVVLTASDSTAGTAVIKTVDAGSATEPESGAVIMVRIFGEVQP